MVVDPYKLADEIEMWGKDLLSLNMKGGVPVMQGAELIREQASRIANLETTLNMYKGMWNFRFSGWGQQNVTESETK